MPAYWGIAAWTGAGLWPHMSDAFYDVSGPDDPTVEVFAVANEAGGRNLVVLNKAEDGSRDLDLFLEGSPDRSFDVYRTDPAAPYAEPRQLTSGRTSSGRLSLTLPAMTVSVVVLAAR